MAIRTAPYRRSGTPASNAVFSVSVAVGIVTGGIEIAERGGAEAEDGHLQFGAAERAACPSPS